jgi:WD40 repeat protein
VPSVSVERPYKGLRPYEATAADASLFFGRDAERDLIAANLVAARLTVLYGASGVGKSSVLRAGVVQALREQSLEGGGFAVALYADWSVDDPVEALAETVREAVAGVIGSLADDPGGPLARRLAAWCDLLDGDLYLVLDQVDEYFFYHPAGPLLDEFPALVSEPGLRVHALLGVREDALASLDVFKAHVPALFRNYLRLEPLGRDAGRDAIVGPLGRLERPVEIEPALVDSLLDEVAVGQIEANGGPPAQASGAVEPAYLQIVLERIWDTEREEGSDVLRAETLRRLGGARRIVSEHLDRALASLDPDERETAAAMFAHLVTPSGAKVAHNVADLAQYAGVDANQARDVVQMLLDERILRGVEGRNGDSHRVEIFHDVLASAVADWRVRHDIERVQVAAARRHRRLLIVIALILVALAATAGLAVYAFAQKQDADTQRNAGRARELAALALAGVSNDPVGALQLAVDASRRSGGTSIEDALRTVLLATHEIARFGDGATPILSALPLPGGSVATGDEEGRFTAYRPNGAIAARLLGAARVRWLGVDGSGAVVSVDEDGHVSVWDAASWHRLRAFGIGPIAVAAVDGRIAAAGNRTLSLYTSRGRRVWRRPLPSRPVDVVAKQGVVLAAGRRWLRLYRADSGRTVFAVRARGISAVDFTLKPRRLVATGGEDKTVRLWDGRTGKPLAQLNGHTGQVLDVAFDPTGALLASASADEGARVWDVRKRQPYETLTGHTNQVLSVAFGGPDTLLTTSADGTARVWRPDGDLLATLVGHRDAVTGGALAGGRALTWSNDGTARLWRYQPDPRIPSVGRYAPGATAVALSARGTGVALCARGGFTSLQQGPCPAGKGTAVAVSADGTHAAVGEAGGTVVVIAASGAARPIFHVSGGVSAAALDRHGVLLAVAGPGGAVRVLRASGGLVRPIDTGIGGVTAVALSDDGALVAAAGADGKAGVWNVRTGDVIARLAGPAGRLLSIVFSPDGDYVATTNRRTHEARIWRISDATTRWVLGHIAVVHDATFSPDGRWIVTAGPQRVVLWEMATGKQVVKLQGGKGQFLAARFSADGRSILTANTSGRLGRWECSICAGVDGLRAQAEERLSRTRPRAR